MSETESRRIQVDLSGQTAIVTGASRGIGKAIAVALGKAGARVACIARNEEKLKETVDEIVVAGGAAEAFSLSVTDSEAVQQTVEQIAEEWGKLDIVVNNAGITRDTLLPRMSDEEWDDVIATNLRSIFLFSRAGIQAMGLELWAASEAIASPTTTAVRTPDGIDEIRLRATVRERYGVVLSSGRAETLGKLTRIGHMGPTAHPIYAIAALTALGGGLRAMGRDVAVAAGVDAAMAVIDAAA